MFDVLLSGKLRGTPDVRSSKNGNPFATFRLNVPTGKDGGYTQASCIAFSTSVIEAMQALTEGDSVAVNGEAVIKTWEGKHGIRTGLDVTVHGVLTAYHLGRKREAVTTASQSHGRSGAGAGAGHGQDQPTRPKFHHPDFKQPDLSGPDPDGWDSLDGV